MLARITRVRDLVVLVVAVDEVLEDGTRLKDANGLAVGPCVSDGGNAAVGVNFQEPWLLLGVV